MRLCRADNEPAVAGLQELGRAHRELGQIKEAARAFLEALEEAKGLTRQILLARTMAWAGRVEEAVGILSAAGERPENKPAVTQALIEVYAEAGKWEQAIGVCAKAIETADAAQKPELQSRLAGLYAGKGDVESARKLLETIAAGNTSAWTRTQIELARLLWNQKQTEQAREVLIGVVAKDAGDLTARLLLLALEPVPGKGPSQQELVEQMKGIEGTTGLNWRYWQAILWLTGDDWAKHSKDIQTLLEECLAKDPEWDAACLALGNLYEKAGDTNKGPGPVPARFHRQSEQHPPWSAIPVVGREGGTVERCGQYPLAASAETGRPGPPEAPAAAPVGPGRTTR